MSSHVLKTDLGYFKYHLSTWKQFHEVFYSNRIKKVAKQDTLEHTSGSMEWEVIAAWRNLSCRLPLSDDSWTSGCRKSVLLN